MEEKMGNNSSKAVLSKNAIVLEILRDEFGSHLVEKALKHQESCRAFEKYDPDSISKCFNALSYSWQTGNARQYLESLDECVQFCLICHLSKDYINDKVRANYV
jgi:hypothetical protein